MLISAVIRFQMMQQSHITVPPFVKKLLDTSVADCQNHSANFSQWQKTHETLYFSFTHSVLSIFANDHFHLILKSNLQIFQKDNLANTINWLYTLEFLILKLTIQYNIKSQDYISRTSIYRPTGEVCVNNNDNQKHIVNKNKMVFINKN